MSKRALAELLYNRSVAHVPHTPVRTWTLRKLGAELGAHVYLFGGTEYWPRTTCGSTGIATSVATARSTPVAGSTSA
jgi:hypothetical protein